MPPSDAERDSGQDVAVISEILYLANLMLLPVLAFLILLGYWWRHRKTAGPLGRCHLAQTVSAR